MLPTIKDANDPLRLLNKRGDNQIQFQRYKLHKHPPIASFYKECLIHSKYGTFSIFRRVYKRNLHSLPHPAIMSGRKKPQERVAVLRHIVRFRVS